MTTKAIFTVTDITGKVWRSTPVEMDDYESARIARTLEDMTTLAHFRMTTKDKDGIPRIVYFNPKQVIAISVEEVK